MKRILTIFFLVLCTTVLKAQLYFKNSSSKPVLVAYCMQSNSKGDDAWYTYGWYSADPNQTIQLSSAVGLNPNVYYYAQTKDGKMVWNGENRDGSVRFLVSHSAFTIKNANMQYVKDDNPEYYWISFRHITIGTFQLRYTIEISD